MEKRNTLKRRAGEETKPVPQIYNEECSNASNSLETAGHTENVLGRDSCLRMSRSILQNRRTPPDTSSYLDCVGRRCGGCSGCRALSIPISCSQLSLHVPDLTGNALGVSRRL
ncbi:hypothetical protein T12_5667 [Trichinella patagoniensis]|uniref:Uncharacterized protein n=1 Tax=Trichinella patagoniensis TaxID=990121 RepID=A0A0V1A254_9BILA|nr:hypothetical protein T12_5667 [Trichinella patagoniensis]